MERVLTKLTLALFVGLGACETLPGEPPCATGCISSAISVVSCLPTDLGCQCSAVPQIAFLAGPCLIASCSPDELQSLSTAESAACSSFSAGKLSTLGNNLASATRTSSTAAMASPTMGLGPPPPQVQTMTAAAQTNVTSSTAAAPTSTVAAIAAAAAAGQGLSDDTIQSAKLGNGGSAAIGLSGVIAGAGAVSIIMWTWQRKKRRAEEAAARKKESIPVDDLAAWVQQNSEVEEQRGETEDEKDEKGEKRDLKKLRYTGINMTGANGPIELEVPAIPLPELPGTVLRHEFE